MERAFCSGPDSKVRSVARSAVFGCISARRFARAVITWEQPAPRRFDQKTKQIDKFFRGN